MPPLQLAHPYHCLKRKPNLSSRLDITCLGPLFSDKKYSIARPMALLYNQLQSVGPFPDSISSSYVQELVAYCTS